MDDHASRRRGKPLSKLSSRRIIEWPMHERVDWRLGAGEGKWRSAEAGGTWEGRVGAGAALLIACCIIPRA